MSTAVVEDVQTHDSTTTDTQHTPVWKTVWSVVSTCVLLVLLLIVLVIKIIPMALGATPLTVLTGSMEPTYSPGDIVVVKPQDTYQVGDIVTFQPISNDPTLVTHRVIQKVVTTQGAKYVTQGDANNVADDPLVEAQIQGKALYHVPKVGYLSEYVADNAKIVTIGTLALIAGLLGSIIWSWTPFATKKRKDSEKTT